MKQITVILLLVSCTTKNTVEISHVAPVEPIEVVQDIDTINYIALAVEHLKQHEGFRSNWYTGAGGSKLIGYGHKQLNGETYINLTLEMAHNLLESDFTIHLALVEIKYPHYTHKQQVGLALFSFNLGSGALRKAVINGITTAPNKWLRYCHYRNSKGKMIKSKRLYDRRMFEVELFFIL